MSEKRRGPHAPPNYQTLSKLSLFILFYFIFILSFARHRISTCALLSLDYYYEILMSLNNFEKNSYVVLYLQVGRYCFDAKLIDLT